MTLREGRNNYSSIIRTLDINILKKTNNINLSTKNNISKANPSFKNKKYKKNKAQHLHNNKKV